jgi:hypothetical protein
MIGFIVQFVLVKYSWKFAVNKMKQINVIVSRRNITEKYILKPLSEIVSLAIFKESKRPNQPILSLAQLGPSWLYVFIVR